MSSTRDIDVWEVRTSFTARYARFRTALHHAQKSGAGVPAYTRWINRRLARGAAAAAAAAGLSPNAVTMLSAAVSMLGLAALLLCPATLATGVLVAALLATGYVLDSSDGQVARVTGQAGPTGEWLDHVVDAIRTPAIHVCVAVAIYLHRGSDELLMVVALAYAVLSAGQFMSQILADQLDDSPSGPADADGGTRKSLVLLPTDTGVLCWMFALWGLATVFTVGYVGLFVANAAHTAVSMRRKYVRLRDRPASDPQSHRAPGGA